MRLIETICPKCNRTVLCSDDYATAICGYCYTEYPVLENLSEKRRNKTTEEQISTLNHILGRLEGIAFGVKDEDLQNYLLDTAELMAELLDKITKGEKDG